MFGKVRIGICHWSLPVEGPAACELAAELGFEGIQLDIGQAEKGFPLALPYVQEMYRNYAKQAGIEFPSIAVREFDHYGMTRKNGTVEKQIVFGAIEKAVSIAVAMNIPIIMLPSFEDGTIKTEEDFQNVADCLRYACDLALPSNTTIATENLLSIQEMKRLHEVVGRENLKLYFDTQNYPLRKDYNAAEMVEALAPHICEFHVKDGKDGHMSGALLGEGDSGFNETMDAFRKVGYTGWINVENYYDQKPLSQTGEDPLELAKKDFAILKSSLRI
ncbi:sugar phosphate isomerase/epimerase family protein [Shouchella shacheensis]|uniref:sugar phosphate isomerase/epimerase family protein n=1 Tax=Shouchella shacheensis TaxID=1649580 RepID=UPI00073FDD77|nr:sugar phosphate isomerase/epimerase family protein [Shouchella shacheensis]